MQALLTPEQELVAETAARIASGGLARSRALLNDTALADDPTLDLVEGWSALGLPEDQGGEGDMIGAVLLVHALGEAAEPSAFLSHFHALHALAGAGIAADLLGDGRLAALADRDSISPTRDAELVVLPADNEWRLAEVKSWEAVLSLDPARRAGRAQQGHLIAHAEDSGRGLSRVQVLLASEACGVGRGAIGIASEYACIREQFGKPIGSYQAIGHRLAQAVANIEAAWSLTLYAAWALDHAPELATNAALMAKASAGDAALYACEACVQTHGGMGITREADPHIYLKRAFAIDAAWGRSAALNREIGDGLLLA